MNEGLVDSRGHVPFKRESTSDESGVDRNCWKASNTSKPIASQLKPNLQRQVN